MIRKYIFTTTLFCILFGIFFPIYPLQAVYQEKIAKEMNQISLVLRKPLYASSEFFIDAYFPSAGLQEYSFGMFALHNVPLSIVLWEAANSLDTISEYFRNAPYTYSAERSTLHHLDKKEHSFLSLNVCMLPGGLPTLFGGVKSAHERLKGISDLILKEDADIVALQEAFYPAAEDLEEMLKDRYSYFYTRIGPNPQSIGETGLFIASKEPIISNPVFVPLYTEGALKRGFFYFETKDFWVITTHLESGILQENSLIRKVQLEQINDRMKELKQVTSKPCVVMGDLNIARTGEVGDEYTNSEIGNFFYDPYKEKAPYVNEKTATATDQFTFEVREEDCPIKDAVIDYILIDKASQDDLEIDVTLINTYDKEKKDRALSDHKALKAKIRIL